MHQKISMRPFKGLFFSGVLARPEGEVALSEGWRSSKCPVLQFLRQAPRFVFGINCTGAGRRLRRARPKMPFPSSNVVKIMDALRKSVEADLKSKRAS
jgi:hypothetical protein